MIDEVTTVVQRVRMLLAASELEATVWRTKVQKECGGGVGLGRSPALD